MPNITYYLERDDQEIEVGVDYDYHAGSRGGFYEPPAESYVEVTAIIALFDGKQVDIEVTADEQRRIEAACMDDVNDRYEAAMEAKAEARAEWLREHGAY